MFSAPKMNDLGIGRHINGKHASRQKDPIHRRNPKIGNTECQRHQHKKEHQFSSFLQRHFEHFKDGLLQWMCSIIPAPDFNVSFCCEFNRKCLYSGHFISIITAVVTATPAMIRMLQRTTTEKKYQQHLYDSN